MATVGNALVGAPRSSAAYPARPGIETNPRPIKPAAGRITPGRPARRSGGADPAGSIIRPGG
jgi:hypothetical protein